MVLEDAGLPRPPAQDAEEPLDLSKEFVSQADGDVVFVWSYDPAEREELEKIEAGDHWYGGGRSPRMLCWTTCSSTWPAAPDPGGGTHRQA